MRLPRLLVFASLAALAQACAASPSAPSPGPEPSGTLTPVPATPEWPSSASPSGDGLDPARLSDLVLRIRRGDYGRIHSLLISRYGRLSVEEYFSGWTADQAHTQQSVSKSVTSLLVGLAIQTGRLRADDRVVDLFPAYAPVANLDARKAAMTVGDLLTMRSGLDWDESSYPGSPLQRLNDCNCDWLRFVLDWPMREAPGTRWEYVSGATILLGGVVGAATGSRLDQFAEARLFAPIEESGAYWARGLPDLLPHAGGGLFLRPRDMVKIGALVASNGRWRGRPVVSATWIETSTAPVVRGVRTWAGQSFDYGYGWWSFQASGEHVVVASGARGQWIFAVPRLQLAMSVTSENADGRWVAPLEFFLTHIMPALTR